MAARLKRPAYGLNDAPRRWWNVLDTKLRSYGLEPARADRCTYVLYKGEPKKSTIPCGRTNTWSYGDLLDTITDYLTDPVSGSNSKGRSVSGVA